jgi:molybdopterin/thiamine biosynthesis adenylyltransferase
MFSRCDNQFLLRDGDRGKPKAKLVADRLNSLNPLADVRTIPGALTVELLLNYHVRGAVYNRVRAFSGS